MGKLSDEAVAAGLLAAKRLHGGELPREAELTSAPFITGWLLSGELDGFTRLGGFVSGHPVLPDGWCWTSVVLIIDPDLRWARTVSRLYRLGEPFRSD
jgi:hypothetical protein